jgi:hypothetical protein
MMTNVISQDAALWKCESCGSWWCSQPALAPTDFLHQLPPALAEDLPWDEFRGWAVGTPAHVAACLECDTVSSSPLYGAIGEATRLQPMFALHAARGMSVRNMGQSGFPFVAAQ